jgi:hypothetical protein
MTENKMLDDQGTEGTEFQDGQDVLGGVKGAKKKPPRRAA